MTPDKFSRTGNFRMKTQPSTKELLAQKNIYHRYDTSLFHKTKFHLRPLRQNPQLFTKIDSIGEQLLKLKRNNTTLSPIDARKSSVMRRIVGEEGNKNKKNLFLPHSINIRNKLKKYTGNQQKLQLILQNDNKILVTSKKWIIFDMQGNKTIKGYKHKKSHDIASLTKIMTFYTAYMIIQKYYLAIDKFQLISDVQDSKLGGTKIHIQPQTIVTLEDMLYAMMLSSANNAATIIATNLGSFIDKKKNGNYFSCFDIPNEKKQKNMNIFLQLMNAYTKQLGMTETIFVNVHGMQKNISTARDIAILTSQCYKIPLFSKVVISKTFQITLKYVSDKGEIQNKHQLLTNTNKLLWLDSGCIGGKTGCNIKGGQSLAACYQGNIIVVVLGCANRQQKFADSQKLVGWLYNKLQ